MYNFIKTNIENDVARLTFSRPEKKNAFHSEMISEIQSAMVTFSKDNKIRAVVIEAEGNTFSAGADLNHMKSMASVSEQENKKDAIGLFNLFLSVYECPIPVICLVTGPSYGGANGILAAADYVMATEEAIFSFSEVNLGILPATISPFVVLKIGLPKSLDLFTSGRRFTAKEAEDVGLIDLVIEETSAEDELSDYVSHILSSAPNAVKNTKALLRSFAPLKPAELLEKTTALIAEARVSEEGQEGITAFFEKRNPYWNQ